MLSEVEVAVKFEQLEQLDAIERCGTFSAAADELHATQPSLSRSMRALEGELGQELFSRSRNSAKLNEAGRLAVTHARRILAERASMRDAFDELAKRQRTVRVASVAPAPVWKLGKLVADHMPDVILDPELASDGEVQRRLVNNEAVLAVTRHPIQLPTFACIPLMTEDLYLSVPAGHRLADKSSVSFSDIDGEALLVYEQIGVWMDICRDLTPNSQIIVQKDRVVFMQLVSVTKLCCFTTQAKENACEDSGRVVIPIEDAAAHATFFLCAREDAAGQAKAVMDIVRSFA